MLDGCVRAGGDEFGAMTPKQPTKDQILDVLAELILERLKARAEVEAEDQPTLTTGYVKLEDAARHFSLSSKTIRRWCKLGAPHKRQGTAATAPYLVLVSELRAWALKQDWSKKKHV